MSVGDSAQLHALICSYRSGSKLQWNLQVVLSYAEIENILSATLPTSAYKYREIPRLLERVYELGRNCYL